MLEYLRILLNARLAKMDERGASAVEYGLLIAGIAALIVVVVFAFERRHQEHLQPDLQERRQVRRRRHRQLLTCLPPERGPGSPRTRPWEWSPIPP